MYLVLISVNVLIVLSNMASDNCVFRHYKAEAAAEARILKLAMVRAIGVRDEQVFLDSDDLSDLNDLKYSVQHSDCLVLLYTDKVLSRPWCLLGENSGSPYFVASKRMLGHR